MKSPANCSSKAFWLVIGPVSDPTGRRFSSSGHKVALADWTPIGSLLVDGETLGFRDELATAVELETG